MPTIRLNWIAILVAAIASFLFQALWYSLFMTEWLAGVDRTREWLMNTSVVTPPLQYGTAILCSVIAAAVLSVVIQASGKQNVQRGVLCAALIWLGFVATTWAREYIFEVRPLQLFFINAGYSLIDLILIGAIVGGWKKKSQPTLS